MLWDLGFSANVSMAPHQLVDEGLAGYIIAPGLWIQPTSDQLGIRFLLVLQPRNDMGCVLIRNSNFISIIDFSLFQSDTFYYVRCVPFITFSNLSLCFLFPFQQLYRLLLNYFPFRFHFVIRWTNGRGVESHRIYICRWAQQSRNRYGLFNIIVTIPLF
jgi:hypothetical protein